MYSEKIIVRVSADALVAPKQAAAVEKLLADGCTVPFIARYRKEAHGNLDEVKITKIKERLEYYGELEDRKKTILKSINEQGKLTEELEREIENCFVKTTLEDIYQPFKPKRRTRAQVAKEKGFEPLAEAIWNGEALDAPEEDLQYARDIIAEKIADNSIVRGLVRRAFATKGVVKSEVASPKPAEPTKFEQYYDFSEPIATIPSHRYLAIRRGQKEGILWVRLEVDKDPIIDEIIKAIDRDGEQIRIAALDAYKRLLAPSCEIDVTVEKKMEADRAAVEVFAENLRHLLLASPLGEKSVLALDPGIRTGCKVAMLNSTGKFLGKAVIYPTQNPQEAEKAIGIIVQKYSPQAIAVGNGTAGRETESFVRNTLKKLGRTDIITVSVSESGASVYSASEIARKEFPDLDLTIRGAISIGRRLQDPLAELVKIDPKAIGVGQYQHDVHQPLLGAKLDEVVVSCVNGVGVELNTASAPLLERVSGVGPTLAKSIVEWRNEHGRFTSRSQLLEVKGLGSKAFEQCAGFLRIRGAINPLDSSAVHPERYKLVGEIAKDLGLSVGALVGNSLAAKKIDIKRYITNEVGEPTLKDIVAELVKPGRDPRATFEPPKFRDDVTKIEDVKEGQKLEGIVTNVTQFGAFVDIGVHQDGLIHISELSDNYVTDPKSIVKTGDKITVTVIGVDVARSRISLSARSKPSFSTNASSSSAAESMRNSSSPRRPNSFARSSQSSGFSCNPFQGL